jgi:hypothetical protein
MNKRFLESSLWRAEYVVSPYTNSSYYASTLEGNFELADKREREAAMKEDVAMLVQCGEEWLLPHRIGFMRGGSMASVSYNGRARNMMDAQLKGAFTQVERSPYKVNKPYEVQTGLWRYIGTQTIFYGSIGITGNNGRIDRDNGDLVLVRTADWERVEIFIFQGLAGLNKQLDFLDDAVDYIKGL